MDRPDPVAVGLAAAATSLFLIRLALGLLVRLLLGPPARPR